MSVLCSFSLIHLFEKNEMNELGGELLPVWFARRLGLATASAAVQRVVYLLLLLLLLLFLLLLL